MAKDPAEYRWSSYGEAIGGGNKGNGKKALAGLVRAMRAHLGTPADATFWAHDVSREYRKLLLTGSIERKTEAIGKDGKLQAKTTRKGISKTEAAGESESESADIPLGKMLRHRIRYFTDGAVIGSRNFINEAFDQARERFGPKRKTGLENSKAKPAPRPPFSGVCEIYRKARKHLRLTV